MSKIKKVFKPVKKGIDKVFDDFIPNEAKPIVAPLVGAVNPLAGALVGAGMGIGNNYGAGGTLLSALSGAVPGPGGLGSKAAGALGLGATGTSALTGALAGAASGGATGGLKGALTGGAIGGAGGALLGGAAPSAARSGYDGFGRPLTAGSGAGSLEALPGLTSFSAGGGGGGGTTNVLKGFGTGIKDALLGKGWVNPDTGATVGRTGGLSGALFGSGLLSGVGQGLAGGLLGRGADAFSDYNAYKTHDDIENQLLEAQGKAQEVIEPYAELGTEYTSQIQDLIDNFSDYSSRITREVDDGSLGGTFELEDFQNDPGYEFRKQEGQQAVERQLRAMGLGESGAAIKRSAEFNQGLADQSFQSAFDRWMQQQGNRYGILSDQQGTQIGLLEGQQDVGLDATNSLANILVGKGDITAATSREKAELLSKALANLFRGNNNFAVA